MKTAPEGKPRAGKPMLRRPSASDGRRLLIKDFSIEDLCAFLEQRGHEPYRGRQVWEWLHGKCAASFDEMRNLPRALREDLSALFAVDALAVDRVLDSQDGSRKFLLRAVDGETIQSVLMPDGRRLTLCVSSQAGCAMGCAFCLTGAGGLRRKLETAEIVDQAILAAREPGALERISNLVFMGMGEPLANFDSVGAALRMLTHEKGLAFAPRRITVSTAGLANRIRRAAREWPPVNLAVSLNAPDDALRDRLMPVNRKFPIEELLGACRHYARATGRQVTIEYVLLDGVNHAPRHARTLAKRLDGMPCKVNLIPFNPFEGASFKRPSDNSVLAFQEELKRNGIEAFVRNSRGRDIGAACGQLGGNPHGR